MLGRGLLGENRFSKSMFENVLKKMAVIGPEEKDMRLRLVQHVVYPTVHDICFIYRHSLITVISYYVCIVKSHTLVIATTSQ